MFEPQVIVNTPLSGIVIPSGATFYDNSMLDCMRVCDRKYYFRHIRYWEIDAIKLALLFGTSWHGTMDFVWANKELTEPQLIEGGRDAFMQTWPIAPEMDMDNYPRTPGRAFDILNAYVKKYHSWLKSIEVLSIEQPFVVPLVSDHLYYIGKLDKIIREFNRIWYFDHKTASSIKDQWLQSFSPNGQMDGYLHAGHSSYDNFAGVMIDGALVQKTSVDFKRVPIMRDVTHLDSWLWEVEELIDQIKLNEERLLEIRSNVASGKTYSFLPAFPKKTSSCTTYYGICPYIDLCKFISNPETISCPEGFTESKWVPFNITEKPDGFGITIVEKGI